MFNEVALGRSLAPYRDFFRQFEGRCF